MKTIPCAAGRVPDELDFWLGGVVARAQRQRSANRESCAAPTALSLSPQAYPGLNNSALRAALSVQKILDVF